MTSNRKVEYIIRRGLKKPSLITAQKDIDKTADQLCWALLIICACYFGAHVLVWIVR